MRNFRGVAGAAGARHALVVAALALFGLLSMHGWGTHVGMHPGTHQSSAHALMAVDAHGHQAGASSHTSSAGSADVGCGDSCGDSGSDSGAGLMGLCLAVLGAFALGLALVLLRRGVRLLRTPTPAWRPVALLGRDRDPPDLLRLCVIRC